MALSATRSTVNEERMRRNVKASNGLMLAEAISFALAETMDRAEAELLYFAFTFRCESVVLSVQNEAGWREGQFLQLVATLKNCE